MGEESSNKFCKMLEDTPIHCPQEKWLENLELLKEMGIFTRKHVNYKLERNFLEVISWGKSFLAQEDRGARLETIYYEARVEECK